MTVNDLLMEAILRLREVSKLAACEAASDYPDDKAHLRLEPDVRRLANIVEQLGKSQLAKPLPHVAKVLKSLHGTLGPVTPPPQGEDRKGFTLDRGALETFSTAAGDAARELTEAFKVKDAKPKDEVPGGTTEQGTDQGGGRPKVRGRAVP